MHEVFRLVRRTERAMTSRVIERLRLANHPPCFLNHRDSQMKKSSIAAWGWVLAIAMSHAAGSAIAGTGMSAATPHTGPEYAQLATLSGHWAVRQSIWTDPKTPPGSTLFSRTVELRP